MKRIIYPLTLLAIFAVCAVAAFFLAKPEEPEDVAAAALTFTLPSGQKLNAWSAGSGDYYLFLPSFADPKTITAPKGMSVPEPDNIYTISVNDKSVKLHVLRSANVPTIFIDTVTGKTSRIHIKKGVPEDAGITIIDPAGKTEYASTGGDIVKGRGNGTWMPEKKPYNIRLASPKPLLGMPAGIDWALIANYYDKTKIRNKIICDFARDANIPRTPYCEFADVYVNGNYAGLYLLSQKASATPVKSGELLFEVGMDFQRNPDDVYFTTNYAARGRLVKFANPKRPSDSQLQTLRRTLLKAEENLEADAENDTWTNAFDLDTTARIFLLDEVFMNTDADTASCFYILRDGVIYSGPIWDYDGSCGHEKITSAFYSGAYPEQFYLANGDADRDRPWYHMMMENDMFMDKVKELYRDEYMPLLKEYIEERIPATEKLIEQARSLDHIRWPQINAMPVAKYLREKTDFLNRIWIDGAEYVNVRFYNEENIVVNHRAVLKGSAIKDPPPGAWYRKENMDSFDFDEVITTDTDLYCFEKWK